MTLIMTVIVPCERLVHNDPHYDGHSFAVYPDALPLLQRVVLHLFLPGLPSHCDCVRARFFTAVLTRTDRATPPVRRCEARAARPGCKEATGGEPGRPPQVPT